MIVFYWEFKMKVIIFDIDDTLIEWKKEFIFALKNVLK